MIITERERERERERVKMSNSLVECRLKRKTMQHMSYTQRERAVSYTHLTLPTMERV